MASASPSALIASMPFSPPSSPGRKPSADADVVLPGYPEGRRDTKARGYRGTRRTKVNGENWIEVMASNDAWRPGYFVRESQVEARR
jgi:hypothetical protein